MKEKIGHVALGFLAGLAVRRMPAFSVCLTLIMGRYQRLEQNILRDAGFHEMWQYGAGFVAGAIAGMIAGWLIRSANAQEAVKRADARGYVRGRQDERWAILEAARIAEKIERGETDD